MSARKIALLVVIVAFAASVETAWNVRGDVRIGPEGCRVMGGRFYGPSWSFEAQAERPVPAGKPTRLEVANAFGGVSVKAGAPGIVKVRLRKVVFLATEEKARAFAERIELRLTGDAELVKLATNRDELAREDTGFETHLEIEAPSDTALQVRNEHGHVEVAGVAAADVDASFDGVKIERVAGDVKLEARHGDVELDEIGGGLALKARHGNVKIKGVTGAASLDTQHGDVEVERSGGLEVKLQHGALTLEGVGGDLVVHGQHAPVHGADVSGRAEVETTFAEVRLERVGGELSVRAQHGSVFASDVAGKAAVETAFDGITLERIGGRVEAIVHHGGVEARGLARGGLVRAAGADVTLDGEIVARATHGDVQLTLPEDSRFELDAESSRGRVDAPFDGITVADERHRGQRASGKHAGGGVSLRLTADGDVTLASRPARSRDDWAVARPRTAVRAPVEATAGSTSPAPKTRPAPAMPAEAPATPPQPPRPES